MEQSTGLTGVLRYLLSKFYCPNVVAYSTYAREYGKPIMRTELPEKAIVLDILDTIYKVGGLYVEPNPKEERYEKQQHHLLSESSKWCCLFLLKFFQE